ncbi:autotransporter domain-containing protein [Herbaspirillum sp. alder98]|uniref:autotransporter domain-containing protein n=1 Tax=Herbaspirillum sp. alder98 TaxID=2913096 RepID=UPI001CD84A40|nr:autotransporter domain-containing protein [Herbaspirillum sp. alder98]MCA1323390.1 autotransporter domain-containing protein [Herbaspirillum sp. alder98]
MTVVSRAGAGKKRLAGGKTSTIQPGQLTLMAVALAAALAAPTWSVAAAIPGGSSQYLWTAANQNVELGTGTVLSVSSGAAVYVSGTVGTLTNQGSINGYGGLNPAIVVDVTSAITAINNTSSGTLSGDTSGLSNYGRIGLLSNSGTIMSSGSIGVLNIVDPSVTTASISTLTNTGRIFGAQAGVSNQSATIGTLQNSGVITSPSGRGVENILGTIGVLDNQAGGSITGSVVGVYNSGSIGTIRNGGTINGATYGLQNISGGTIGVLDNTSLISAIGNSAVNNQGSITSLINSGTIRMTGSVGNAITNGGRIGTLANTGVIQGAVVGVSNSGSIGTLSNTSTLTGTTTGLYNGLAGTLNSVLNSGTISGSSYGIQSDNGSSITSLQNTSTGLIRGGTAVLVGNLTPSGTINVSTLTNNGSISGTTNVGVGTSANGAIGSLINTGTITGALGGIGNAGRIGTLSNSGTLTSSGYALYNAATGTIGATTNSGTISSTVAAIYNAAGGTLGPVTNTGLIAGAITNLSSNALTINGGSGSTFGTLTGATGSIGSANMGAITSTAANLVFNSGNLLLNDSINVGSRTVSNTGASLQVNNRVTITGNYNQGAAAALLIGVGNSAVTNGVAADTGYGRLVVSGAATIASGSSVKLNALSNSYGFAVGQRYVVVQAATSGTNYNASSLVYSATGYSGSITGSVLIDGSNSDLLLTLSSSGGGGSGTGGGGGSSGGGSSTPNISATTPNAVSAISGLFNYGGANAGLLNVFNASAALGSTAEANRAGARLSPSSNAGAAAQASSAPTQSVLNVAAAHVDGLRTAQADGASGIATGERDNNVALWGQAFGGKATQDQRNNVSGYSANYNGLLIGGDKLLNDAWRLGGLFSYTNTSISNRDDNSGSSTGLKSYGLIAYAGYTADSWYLDLSGGVVRHKYNTTRVIDFTGFSGTANGSYNGTQSVLSAQGGYPIRLDATTVLTPIAGLNYSKLSQNGYTESGGNGAALTVGANKSTSLKSDLGAKLERSFSTSYGSLTPSAQLTWRHEYQDTRLRSVASFAADTSGATSFVSYGAKPVSNTGIMALGLTLVRSNNLTMTARYTLEAASGYKAQTADVRLRYQF